MRNLDEQSKVLADNPLAYEYDNVYDEIVEQRNQQLKKAVS